MNNPAPRIALYPGSFDPFTVGHESVVNRGLQIFDKIIIGIGYNTNKTDYFPVEKRIRWIRRVFDDLADRVEVTSFKGLTTDFCRLNKIPFILRGLRTAADFEYERAIAQTNKAMFPDIETVFILTLPQHTFINSSVIREIIKQGGDASRFLPEKYKID